MEKFKIEHNGWLSITDWTNEKLIAGFTNRLDGVSNFGNKGLNMAFHVNDLISNVIINREKIAKEIGMPLSQWIGADQTHETNIEVVGKLDAGKGAFNYETGFIATDGLFTLEKDILLTLCFADCVPIFFKDKKNRAVALAHAGWKSTVGLIAPKMIDVFLENGIAKEDIEIVIGPSICEKCYRVDGKLIKIVQNILDTNIVKPYNQIGENEYLLDLKLVNKLLLQKCGIQNITVSQYCTSCSNDLFFSHRKEKGHTGRMMSFIGIREDL